jgi:hypothetical protein
LVHKNKDKVELQTLEIKVAFELMNLSLLDKPLRGKWLKQFQELFKDQK